MYLLSELMKGSEDLFTSDEEEDSGLSETQILTELEKIEKCKFQFL